MSTQFTLEADERIIGIMPDYAQGPGWANKPLWIHIGNSQGQFRSVCIQPEHQTTDQRKLFPILHNALALMKDACIYKKKRK